MMQAILTRYLGPTNHRGARIKATCCAGSLTLPYEYELDDGPNHVRAAEQLCAKLDWPDQLQSGRLKSGDCVHTLG